MVDKPLSHDVHTPASPQEASPPPARRPGHRPMDMRDTVAEMAERAQIISQEAGTKVAAAMRDVISAAAGITGFAIESARDLTQYMVRRGQMTPEEADKLIREAEAAHDKRPASEKAKPTANAIAAERAAIAKAEAAARAAALATAHPPVGVSKPFAAKAAAPQPPVAAKPAAKAAAKAAAPVKPAKAATRSPAAKAGSGKSARPAKPAKPAKTAKRTNKR